MWTNTSAAARSAATLFDLLAPSFELLCRSCLWFELRFVAVLVWWSLSFAFPWEPRLIGSVVRTFAGSLLGFFIIRFCFPVFLGWGASCSPVETFPGASGSGFVSGDHGSLALLFRLRFAFGTASLHIRWAPLSSFQYRFSLFHISASQFLFRPECPSTLKFFSASSPTRCQYF